jgi:hypothetical protein
MEDRLRNPNWVRPHDWPWAEDWNSPAWREKEVQRAQRLMERREKYGFGVCPACNTGHTAKTLRCRECGYAATETGKGETTL